MAFALGFLTNGILFKIDKNQGINVYGTYISDFSTLSINHDSTYHYSYPFSSGKILKIDDNIYCLNEGTFDGYIALFYDNNVKLVTSNHEGIIKTFSKYSHVESNLSQ